MAVTVSSTPLTLNPKPTPNTMTFALWVFSRHPGSLRSFAHLESDLSLLPMTLDEPSAIDHGGRCAERHRPTCRRTSSPPPGPTGRVSDCPAAEQIWEPHGRKCAPDSLGGFLSSVWLGTHKKERCVRAIGSPGCSYGPDLWKDVPGAIAHVSPRSALEAPPPPVLYQPGLHSAAATPINGSSASVGGNTEPVGPGREGGKAPWRLILLSRAHCSSRRTRLEIVSQQQGALSPVSFSQCPFPLPLLQPAPQSPASRPGRPQALGCCAPLLPPPGNATRHNPCQAPKSHWVEAGVKDDAVSPNFMFLFFFFTATTLIFPPLAPCPAFQLLLQVCLGEFFWFSRSSHPGCLLGGDALPVCKSRHTHTRGATKNWGKLPVPRACCKIQTLLSKQGKEA